MTFQLLPLPYDQDALEPHISKKTIHYHYDVRTAKYFDTASKLAEGTIYENMDLKEVLSLDSLSRIESKLYIQASQAWNHQFYWESMTPKSKAGSPSTEMDRLITESFGGMDSFHDDFIKSINAVVGSGWTWLIYRNKALSIKNIPNAGSPLSSNNGGVPLLVCDAWEHSFEVQYPADKAAYAAAFMNVINWDKVNERLADATK